MEFVRRLKILDGLFDTTTVKKKHLLHISIVSTTFTLSQTCAC